MKQEHNSQNPFSQTGQSETQDLITPVLESHRRLLQSGTSKDEVQEALSRVGGAADVDRVYVFEVEAAGDGTLLANQRFEWVADGITPEIDNADLQNIPLEQAGYARWVRLLKNYEPVFGLIENFPTAEQPLLAAQSIVSLLVVPVFAEGELRGFVGFDHCRFPKVWTESDVDLLLSLSIAIAPIVSRAGQKPDGINIQALDYVSLIGSLLSLREMTDSNQPVSEILGKIRSRIRALVSLHRFLTRRGENRSVDTSRFLEFWEQELRKTLELCPQRQNRLQVMSESFALPEELILQTGLITHELLMAFTCREASTGSKGGLFSLGIHEENGTVAVRLHYTEADENAAPPTPDPLGVVLVRRLVQSLSGYLEIPGSDASARVVIPLPDARGTESA